MPDDKPPVCSGQMHRWEVTRPNANACFTIAEFVGNESYSHKRVYNPTVTELSDIIRHAFEAGRDYEAMQVDAWLSDLDAGGDPGLPQGLCPVCYKPEEAEENGCECDADARKYRVELRKRFSPGGEGADSPRRRYQGGTTSSVVTPPGVRTLGTVTSPTVVTPSPTASASGAAQSNGHSTAQRARDEVAGWGGCM